MNDGSGDNNLQKNNINYEAKLNLNSNNNNSNNSKLTTEKISVKTHEQNSDTTSVSPNLSELAKSLKDYASESNIDSAIELLNKNQDIIKQLKDNYLTIIEYFYPPYSIAYDQEDFNFCSHYMLYLDYNSIIKDS